MIDATILLSIKVVIKERGLSATTGMKIAYIPPMGLVGVKGVITDKNFEAEVLKSDVLCGVHFAVHWSRTGANSPSEAKPDPSDSPSESAPEEE